MSRAALHTCTASVSRAGQAVRLPVQSLRALVCCASLVLLVKALVVERCVVSGHSMAPTLQSEQTVWLNRLAYGLRMPLTTLALRWAPPALGDVVALAGTPFGTGPDLVKRVVALPGDRLAIRSGGLVRNGLPVRSRPGPRVRAWRAAGRVVPLSELYVQTQLEVLGTHSYLVQRASATCGDLPSLRVPPGHVFVLGDNRGDSLDSRTFGPVPLGAIKGRVLVGTPDYAR